MEFDKNKLLGIVANIFGRVLFFFVTNLWRKACHMQVYELGESFVYTPYISFDGCESFLIIDKENRLLQHQQYSFRRIRNTNE